jgi:hypothetical protein
MSFGKLRITSVLGGLGLAGLVLSLAACATTRQTRSVERSGFLGDYSQLQEGEKGEAQLVYVNPEAEFSGYQAVMLDSVTFWYTSEASRLTAEDEQRLTDHLYAALHKELAQDYKIVDRSGPGVMRLRAAITEAKGARVVGNAVTSIVPQLRMLSTVGGMAADTAALVGKVGVEAELSDSLTGQRLLAAVDERAGTKTIRGGLAKWSHVEEAFDFWAKRVRERLSQLRAP